MELQLLWYALASFTLGFIVSTLWEWLHFRQKFAEHYVVYPEDILPTVNAQPENRASSVLLESEQATRQFYE